MEADTTQLKSLYQEVIIDHGRRPRNFGPLPKPTHQLEGFNPLCGDQITLYLRTENDEIKDATFDGKGCAIAMASASLMTQHIKGKSLSEAKSIFTSFRHLVTEDNADDTANELGKLTVLAGVKDYPMRVKCATLAWHTMMGAIEGETEAISTE